jgi:hypothetical protein
VYLIDHHHQKYPPLTKGNNKGTNISNDGLKGWVNHKGEIQLQTRKNPNYKKKD